MSRENVLNPSRPADRLKERRGMVAESDSRELLYQRIVGKNERIVTTVETDRTRGRQIVKVWKERQDAVK